MKKLLSIILAVLVLSGTISEIPTLAADVESGDITFRKDINDVAADLRAGMVNRQETITVGYIPASFSEIQDQTFVENLFDMAMEHTGNPNEGDYLYWQFDYNRTSLEYEVSQTGREFGIKFIFHISYYTTAEQEAEVDALVEQLLVDIDEQNYTTDYEKIKTVYEYICQNITYDKTHASDRNYTMQHTAYAALKNGAVSCRGFSVLLYRLALELGIDSRVIVGTSGGQLHTWNILQMNDGLYYNADATWDSNLVEPACFLKSDASMPDHTRDSEYATEEYYEAYPMGQEDYSYDQESNVLAEGYSGDTKWTLNNVGEIIISGNGNMKNYGYNGGQPWLAYADQITSVVIEDGVTAVGTGSFMGLNNLKSVTLPAEGLKKIGEAAFYGCESLKAITIPEGIYTIWAYTFKGCTALESVKLPKTLIKIDQGAFENCTALPYIFMPTNIEIIGSWSFKGGTSLKEADMQWTDATEIREGAFKNCSALTNIILPVNIQILGDSCFYGIGATSFTVPATVTNVEPWCFARAKVKTITFEGDAPTIGEGAFNKITLTAYYPNGNATWTDAVMQNYGGTVSWKEN